MGLRLLLKHLRSLSRNTFAENPNGLLPGGFMSSRRNPFSRWSVPLGFSTTRTSEFWLRQTCSAHCNRLRYIMFTGESLVRCFSSFSPFPTFFYTGPKTFRRVRLTEIIKFPLSVFLSDRDSAPFVTLQRRTVCNSNTIFKTLVLTSTSISPPHN